MTIAPPETKIVAANRVACDGGESALGHPRVWLMIPAKTGWVECPYCDRRFVLSHHAHAENPLTDPADYEGAGGN